MVEINFDPLEEGAYTLVLRSSLIADRAGNAPGTSDLTLHFTVDPYSIRWIRDQPGEWSWFNPSNWFPRVCLSAATRFKFT